MAETIIIPQYPRLMAGSEVSIFSGDIDKLHTRVIISMSLLNLTSTLVWSDSTPLKF